MIDEPVQRALFASADPDSLWLCCAECRRFFQWREARGSASGTCCRCPFAGCEGRDLDLDLQLWDADRHADDPRWPREGELRSGMLAPDMRAFHQAREARHRAELVARFARSPQRDAVCDIARACWYVDQYLHCLWSLFASPGMDYGFTSLDVVAAAFGPSFAERHPDRIDETDSREIVASMRAFFAFCERELGHERIGQISWSTLGAMIDEELRIQREQLAARRRSRTTRSRARWARSRARRDRRKEASA